MTTMAEKTLETTSVYGKLQAMRINLTKYLLLLSNSRITIAQLFKISSIP
jgi:hypothetical protein